MKKVCHLIIALCILTIAANGAESGRYADALIDNVYERLTVAEQIGQLIDLRVTPTQENLNELIALVTKYQIGSITVSGGDRNAVQELIDTLRSVLKVPIFVTAEGESISCMLQPPSATVPLSTTIVEAGDAGLSASLICELSANFHALGINGITYNPEELIFDGSGMYYVSKSNLQSNPLSDDFTVQYARNDININTDFYFDFDDDFAFSPKLLDQRNLPAKHENFAGALANWDINNLPLSTVTIKSLPDFPENEAIYFYRKIINPLFWKDLEYAGILTADYDDIIKNQPARNSASTVRTLLKIGLDKVCISSEVGKVYDALSAGLEGRYFRQNEIKEKVKRIIRQKYLAGLLNQNSTDYHYFDPKRSVNEMNKLSYEIYSKAIKASEEGEKLMPFVDLNNKNFASLSLGLSESMRFQETLDKYASFVHYQLPGISFNPYETNILEKQLEQFDYVIVGLHTAGLVELDGTLLSFLNNLNNHTQVVIVFLGNSIASSDFTTFKSKIYALEDNAMCQQIAAQYVFGAVETNNAVRRLSFGTPEMQGMDSDVLKLIDDIVKEGIAEGAMPGCQILVARNGSVVLDRGYGYYTYDSIMPVDSRTIYDLASITKVAATTQVLMKLVEEGKIQLDDTLGSYLPNLEGSNKSSLVIKEILAHQSGLRAFYPFWRNTIEDEKLVLHYYKENPTETYINEVAQGMFASEDLKDSLWQWTVDTKLRTKRGRNRYKPYDYRYSDLGFYILQVLAESVSGVSLDLYVDSVFYKPMGMNTLTYNPLCKFPMMRITPTERDTEFRHALVWGTVHDQIAAMKGGVSGHAGLFGNAVDLAKIAQMHLQGGEYGGKTYFEKETVEGFTSQQFPKNRRGLGWDKPDKEEESSSISEYASTKSYGHTGFTGTILWVDPTFNLVFVFLSNRIYPDTGNSKLIDLKIRKRIHDVVYESIWNFEKSYN